MRDKKRDQNSCQAKDKAKAQKRLDTIIKRLKWYDSTIRKAREDFSKSKSNALYGYILSVKNKYKEEKVELNKW